MKNRLASTVAVLLAIVCGVGVFIYATTADQRALGDTASQKVLVAVTQIPAGESLGDAQSLGHVQAKTYPMNALPDDVISEVTDSNRDLLSQVVISKGQLLVAGAFSATTANGLAVPEGQVAVAVSLSDPEHVGQFLTAGSQVVLLNTYLQKTSGSDKPQTSVLIAKVLVLAVGESTSAATEAANASTTVTVAVTPADSVRLVQAARTGQLYFGLLGDKADASKVDTVTPSNLFSKG